MAETERGPLVPIGRFSAVCRLTIKALRHYDELGLLRPALVDPASGYRYYRLDQVATADLIRTLRATEMPLEEIRAILDAPDADAARAGLARQRERVAARLAAQEAALATLDGLIAGGRGDRAYAVALCTVPAQPLYSTRLALLPAELDTLIPRAMVETRQGALRQGGKIVGPAVAIYHDGAPEDERMVVEVGWPVDGALAADGSLGPGNVPGGLVARTTHIGPYDGLSAAYTALAAWLQERGHDTSGAPWDAYVVGPEDGAGPGDYRTEISWPIR